MSRVEFETKISLFERTKAFRASDHAATVIRSMEINILNYDCALGYFLVLRSDLLKTDVGIDCKFYFHIHVVFLVSRAKKLLQLIALAWQGIFRRCSPVPKDEKSEKNCLQHTIK
jgi:hypothetical protein